MMMTAIPGVVCRGELSMTLTYKAKVILNMNYEKINLSIKLQHWTTAFNL